METEIFQGNALNGVDRRRACRCRPSSARCSTAARTPAPFSWASTSARPASTLYGTAYSEYLIGETERRRRLDEDKGVAPTALDDQGRGLFGMTERIGYDSGGRIVLPPMLRASARSRISRCSSARAASSNCGIRRIAIEAGGDVLKQIATFYLAQRGAKA